MRGKVWFLILNDNRALRFCAWSNSHYMGLGILFQSHAFQHGFLLVARYLAGVLLGCAYRSGFSRYSPSDWGSTRILISPASQEGRLSLVEG